MIEVVDDSIVYNDNSDKKDDQRSHKKRLRLKQRSEKQEEVLKILEKFDSIISEKNDLEDIFQSVKIRRMFTHFGQKFLKIAVLIMQNSLRTLFLSIY